MAGRGRQLVGAALLLAHGRVGVHLTGQWRMLVIMTVEVEVVVLLLMMIMDGQSATGSGTASPSLAWVNQLTTVSSM